jgi:hypothetical protein
MIKTLYDYELRFHKISIMCDNTSVIMISKNLVLHLRTKHVKRWHHFIRNHVEKGDIELIHIDINNQIANIFAKTLSTQRHNELRFKLGMFEFHV